jgi:hypothetical protein
MSGRIARRHRRGSGVSSHVIRVFPWADSPGTHHAWDMSSVRSAPCSPWSVMSPTPPGGPDPSASLHVGQPLAGRGDHQPEGPGAPLLQRAGTRVGTVVQFVDDGLDPLTGRIRHRTLTAQHVRDCAAGDSGSPPRSPRYSSSPSRRTGSLDSTNDRWPAQPSPPPSGVATATCGSNRF